MTKPWPPPDRIACLVIGCHRTASKEWAGGAHEIICGKHWRTVPLWMRRRHTKIIRLYKRAKPGTLIEQRAGDLEYLWWGKCKAKAIEIAMGITAA